MYIRNRREFLILENLKQAREFLDKNGIDTNSPEFQHIVKTLNKQPNLIDTFTRMVFKDGLDNLDTNIGEFDRIYNWLSNNRNIVNQLPKNLMQYKNLEDIADDITRLEYDRKVGIFTRKLPSSTRQEVSQLSEEELNKYKELAISYLELDQEQKEMLPPLPTFQKKYGTSIKDLIDSLDSLINSPEDLDQERRRIQGLVNKYIDKLNIIYNKGNVLMIESNDREVVCDLGAERWCFVYAPDRYYKEYIDPDTYNTQYIVFNFNLPPSNRFSMFGVTIQPDGITKFGGSQNKINEPVPLENISELTGVPLKLFASKYKDRYDKLQTDINSIDINTTTYSELLEIVDEANKLGRTRTLTNAILDWTIAYIKRIDTDKLSIRGLIEVLSEIGNMDTELGINGLNKAVRPYTDVIREELVNTLSNDMDEFMMYLSNEPKSLLGVQGNFSSMIAMIPGLTLAEVLQLLYVYIFHSHNEQLPRLIYRESNGVAIRNISKYIPESLITYDNLSNLINSESTILDRLSNIASSEDISPTIRYAIIDLVEIYMTVSNRKTFSEIEAGYEISHEYISEMEVDYINEYALVFLVKYPDESDDIVRFLIDRIHDGTFDLSIVTQMDMSSVIYDIQDKSTLNNIGDLYIEAVSNGDIKDTNTFLLYCASLVDDKYISKFNKEIGLMYSDKHQVWYMITDYGQLGNFFEYPIDLEVIDIPIGEVDDYNYSDYIDNIDINNLSILSKHFKQAGFDIDISSLDKYNVRHVDYGESMELYKKDESLYNLLSTVVDILSGNYDDPNDVYDTIHITELQEYITRAYIYAENTKKESLYLDTQISVIGDRFLKKWVNEPRSFANSYLLYDEDANLLIIPDITKLMNIEYSVIGYLSDYIGLDVFDIEDLVESYLHQTGKLEWRDVDEYISLSEINYLEYNDILHHLLIDEGSLNESINILSLSEYIKINNI